MKASINWTAALDHETITMIADSFGTKSNFLGELTSQERTDSLFPMAGFPQAEPQAHLYNLSEIPRSNGLSLFVECYAGDILTIYSDVLIVSAFAHDYWPTPDSILGAISRRFGLNYGGSLPEGTESVDERLHRFPATPCPAFGSLWVLEMQLHDEEHPFTPAQLRSAFAVLGRSAASLSAARSISLPLLGTGSQSLDRRDVVREIIRLARTWAAILPRLEVVRLFAYSFESIAVLNKTIDELLNSHHAGPASALLGAATAELKEKLPQFRHPNLRAGLGALVQLASASEPSVKSIAVEGRVLAEAAAELLHEHFLPAKSCPKKLFDRLAAIQPHIKALQEWILPYFHLLQLCGNSAAHGVASKVDSTDAAAVVVASIRVAEFTETHILPTYATQVRA